LRRLLLEKGRRRLISSVSPGEGKNTEQNVSISSVGNRGPRAKGNCSLGKRRKEDQKPLSHNLGREGALSPLACLLRWRFVRRGNLRLKSEGRGWASIHLGVSSLDGRRGKKREGLMSSEEKERRRQDRHDLISHGEGVRRYRGERETVAACRIQGGGRGGKGHLSFPIYRGKDRYGKALLGTN